MASDSGHGGPGRGATVAWTVAGLYVLGGAVSLAVLHWQVTLLVLLVVAMLGVMWWGGRLPKEPDADGARAQVRAEKRARRLQDVRDWDHEWFRLQNPGRSSREISAIVDDYQAGRI